MKKLLIKIARRAGKHIGKKNGEALIKLIYRLTDAPVLQIGYQHYGILKYENMVTSGERFVVEKIVQPLINKEDILIDVGANKGDYTHLLEEFFADHRIISVEPNPHTYTTLKERVNSETYNNAIAEEEGKLTFYTSLSNQASTQASFSVESIPIDEEPVELKVDAIRLDTLLKRNLANSIGFLKIDTEGHDFHALKSTGTILPGIKFIQFEFNEKYVYTRTFLKDFYDLFDKTHDLFRLDTNFLHDTRIYLPTNEIFRYQNFLAVRKDLTADILWALK
ncbi:MAG: FkbM family methyltransferase [Cryomorphaceae bacterium]